MATVPIMTAAPVLPTSQDHLTVSAGTEAKLAFRNSATLDLKTSRPILGTTVKISVPLDSPIRNRVTAENQTSNPAQGFPSPKPIRRDSIERREALLKGKEGSRQRRRWENDRLLSNPWAIPPLPSDWEVRPTYPIRSVPYYLAPLWDAAEFQRSVEAKSMNRRKSSHHHRRDSAGGRGLARGQRIPTGAAAGHVPKEVRAKLKRARAAKGLLQVLEEDVRDFVRGWQDWEARLYDEGLTDVASMRRHIHSAVESEEEDEEIVFVGRNGVMHDMPSVPQPQTQEQPNPHHQYHHHRLPVSRQQLVSETELGRDRKVFEGLAGDKGASFARWLVHELGAYYGLRSWSVTVEGEPARREAYVGIHPGERGMMGLARDSSWDLPRPLWGMV